MVTFKTFVDMLAGVFWELKSKNLKVSKFGDHWFSRNMDLTLAYPMFT